MQANFFKQYNDKIKPILDLRNSSLLANIKTKFPELEKLLEEVSSHWGYEDSIITLSKYMGFSM